MTAASAVIAPTATSTAAAVPAAAAAATVAAAGLPGINIDAAGATSSNLAAGVTTTAATMSAGQAALTFSPDTAIKLPAGTLAAAAIALAITAAHVRAGVCPDVSFRAEAFEAGAFDGAVAGV